jgi:predicted nucleic-acid-binding protein
MKGLDTNVLVRYITQDDLHQAELAEREIEEAVLKGEKLVIQPIVLFELVWVLESAYGYRKSEVAPVVDQIMRTAQFEIIEKDILWKAIGDFLGGGADLADYYIGRANENYGAPTTLTFDKALKASPLFTVL